MKAAQKSKPQSGTERRPSETKDDFLRWLRKKKALNKQAAKEKKASAAPLMIQALMVWDDDGGQQA